MRFLKNKIFRAQEAAKLSIPQSSYPSPIINAETQDPVLKENDAYVKMEKLCPSIIERPIIKKSSKRSSLGPNSRNRSSTKNIAINYGRAIASFAGSSLATPYLNECLAQEGLTKVDFSNFLKSKKTKIQGICGLRSILVIENNDEPKVKACKRLFQWLGEVFIKCFSVNWIIHGKVSHKMVYLKFRFKMLRRIKNPEQFTFIKERRKRGDSP